MLHDFLYSLKGEYVLINDKFFGKIKNANEVLLTLHLGEFCVHRESDYGDKTFYIEVKEKTAYVVMDKIESIVSIDSSKVNVIQGDE